MGDHHSIAEKKKKNLRNPKKSLNKEVEVEEEKEEEEEEEEEEEDQQVYCGEVDEDRYNYY